MIFKSGKEQLYCSFSDIRLDFLKKIPIIYAAMFCIKIHGFLKNFPCS